MSRRLTNEMRDEIVKNCLEKTFKKRKATIKKKVEALGDQVYRSHITPSIEVKMKALPNGFFNTITSLRVKIVNGKSANGDDQYYKFESSTLRKTHYSQEEVVLSLSTSRLAPADKQHAIWKLTLGSKLANMLVAIDKLYVELANDRDAVLYQARTMVKAFTTEKKLIEHWPEVADYLPPAPPVTHAVVPLANNLNTLISSVK